MARLGVVGLGGAGRGLAWGWWDMGKGHRYRGWWHGSRWGWQAATGWGGQGAHLFPTAVGRA